MDAPEGPPTVLLPERFDRRLRFGPFPSARDALKFVVYAAVGGVLAPFVSPLLWLPIVAAGFGLSVAKPDGEALDERALAFVLWRLRRRAPGLRMTRRPDSPALRRGLLPRPAGGYFAVLRTAGAPLAYLPPEELERRFHLYRELLRGVDGSLAWTAVTQPLDGRPVCPAADAAAPAERGAASGYAELVTQLCAKRRVRRVDLVLATPIGTADGIAELDRRAARFVEGLSGLGLRCERLAERRLLRAGIELALTRAGGAR